MNATHCHVAVYYAGCVAPRFTTRYLAPDLPMPRQYERQIRRQRGVVAADAFACDCATPEQVPASLSFDAVGVS